MTRKRFRPSPQKVEIEITSECNIHCYNCNRSCRQAPSSDTMTVDQVEKFVWESMAAGWHWHTIGILGGEPTLHPKLEEILQILLKYKESYPCVVGLVTNGFGERTKAFIECAPAWLQIRNSRKTGPIQQFASYNVAPMDLEAYRDADFSAGCPIAAHFGLGLTRHGYYPCGPGASIDRVLGFDIGIKHLERLDENALLGQLKVLCAYCGHFIDSDLGRKNAQDGRNHEERQSAIWRQAYRKYHEEVPVLSIY